MSEWNFDAFLGTKRPRKWQVWYPTRNLSEQPPHPMEEFEPASLGTVPEWIRVCEGDLNQAQIHRSHSQHEYISYIRGIYYLNLSYLTFTQT